MGMAPLRLNVDETSIVLNHDDEKGVVNKSSKGKLVMVKKKSKKRGSLTHVALVCDDSAVQPLLPQFIIGNEHVLRVTDLKALETALAQNIIVIRAKSSWVTVELFIVLLEMLRKVFDAHCVNRVPILLLDCCPVHLHARVWRAARTMCMYLCFVPAGLTWLLQPLDVKILRREKACLRALYRRCQISNHTSLVPVVQIVRNLAQAIRQILQGCKWGGAFDACGYSNVSSNLTSTIRTLLSATGTAHVDVPASKPTEAQIHMMLPEKRHYDLQLLFWEPQTSLVAPEESRAQHNENDGTTAEGNGFPSFSSTGFPGSVPPVHGNHGSEGPIASRTRSQSRLCLEGEDSHPLGAGTSASSAACPSSMLLPAAAPSLTAPLPTRRRAQALPLPRRPRWV